MRAFLFGKWTFVRWEANLGEGLEERWVATLKRRVGVLGNGHGRLVTIYSGPYWPYKWFYEDGKAFDLRRESCPEFLGELQHRQERDQQIELARALEEGPSDDRN